MKTSCRLSFLSLHPTDLRFSEATQSVSALRISLLRATTATRPRQLCRTLLNVSKLPQILSSRATGLPLAYARIPNSTEWVQLSHFRIYEPALHVLVQALFAYDWAAHAPLRPKRNFLLPFVVAAHTRPSAQGTSHRLLTFKPWDALSIQAMSSKSANFVPQAPGAIFQSLE